MSLNSLESKKMNKRTGKSLRNKELIYFDRLLHEWINIIDEYCANENGDDAPYWYNEQASVSLLAGAVWKLKGFAFQEYRDIKGRGKHKWQGRVDLFFRLKSVNYIVEAKPLFLDLTKKSTVSGIKQKIEEKLRTARAEAVESNIYGDKSLGIIFVVPRVLKKNFAISESLLERFNEGLQKADFCFAAWNFPECVRELSFENKLYPGAALVGRVPRRK
jgi:hypothetical protein